MNYERYTTYCDYCTLQRNNNFMGRGLFKEEELIRSVGDGGNTGGEWKQPPPSTSSTTTTTSFLGDRAIRMDTFKLRMEDELNAHINGSNKTKNNYLNNNSGGLIDLLLTLYKLSNSIIRTKIRKWIGQWLHSFSLGNGSSSLSSSVYCPLLSFYLVYQFIQHFKTFIHFWFFIFFLLFQF